MAITNEWDESPPPPATTTPAKPEFQYPLMPKRLQDYEDNKVALPPAPEVGPPTKQYQDAVNERDTLAGDYDSHVGQAWANYQNDVLGLDPKDQTAYPRGYTPKRRLVSGELAKNIVPAPLHPDSPNPTPGKPDIGSEDPKGLVGNTPKSGGGDSPVTAFAPPQVLQTKGVSGGNGGGGGGLSVSGVLGSYVRDVGEQEAAMRREREARTGSDEVPRQTWGSPDSPESQKQGLIPDPADARFGGLNRAEAEGSKAVDAARTLAASENLDRARNDYYQRQHLIDLYQQHTEAYANGKIDPDLSWKQKSVPQKIASIVGAFFLGLGGRPEVALNHLNEQIDRSIAIQQGELERHRVAAGHYQNMYDMALNNTKSRQEAYDFTHAVYMDNTIADVQRSLAPYKNDINKAEIDQFIAMLREQRDMSLMKVLGKTGGGGGATPEGWLTADSKNFVTDPETGQQYLINDAAMAPHIDQQLDAYTRIKSALEQGKQLIDQWNLNPANAVDLYNRGKVIDNAIVEAESKLASARGVPASVLQMVQGMKPTFAYPTAKVSASRIPELEKLLDKWKQDTLNVNHAQAFETRTGPGLGKKAGELTTYARPSPAPQAAPQAPAAAPAQRQYSAFKPNGQQQPAGQ